MKTFFLILSLAFLGLFVSCDTRTETSQQDVLTGVWDLKTFTPGFGPQELYNPNSIVWQFRTDNKLVVAVNTTLPSNSQVPIKTSSTNVYNLIDNSTVVIEQRTYKITISNNQLTLDENSASDGQRIIFNKIEF